MSSSSSSLDLANAQRKPCFWLSGNHFQNGKIDTTNIDMGNPNYSITSLHDPINPQDAATKGYIDRAISNLQNAVQSTYITLTGLDTSLIEYFPSRGSFTIWVSGTGNNSPAAAFTVNRSKTDTIQQPIPFVSGTAAPIAQSGGVGSVSGSYVRLLLEWQTQTDMYGTTTSQLLLHKICDTQEDENMYDGEYKVIYLGSDGE